MENGADIEQRIFVKKIRCTKGMVIIIQMKYAQNNLLTFKRWCCHSSYFCITYIMETMESFLNADAAIGFTDDNAGTPFY